MPALNFSAQFAAAVEDGSKRQTIRRVRKNMIKVGDKLTLYTGQRTPSCRKLREAICCDAIRITMLAHRVYPSGLAAMAYSVWGDGGPVDAAKLARADGFESVPEFFAWFDGLYGLPFEGVVIRW